MRVLRLLRTLLREIFDEAAYERFCVLRGVAIGRESYAQFLNEKDSPRSKVRCC